MDNNINSKIVKGVSWNLIETFILYFTRFIIGVILARLLMPSDFGIIGMTAIFISISDVFVKAGFGQAFIRKKEVKDIDANTVFFINLIIATIIYTILFFSAPLIAGFFHEPLLVHIIRVLCLIIIINSLNVIQYAYIRRDFLFKKKAILTTTSSVSSGIIGIICAYNGLGVWSLVIQQLLNRGLLCSLLYLSSSWKPKFQFSKSIALSFFSYGSWLLLSDVVATIMNNFYRIFIGRFHTTSDLGFYDRAHQFQSMVADTFTWVFGMVAFPSFTKVQDNYPEMLAMAKNFVSFSVLLIYPLLCILGVISQPLISLLLTDKWLPAVPYLQLFCLIGFIIPINFFLAPLLQSAGFTKIDFMSTSFISVMRILNVCLTFKWGIKLLLIGEFIILFLNVIIFSYYSAFKMKCNYLSVIGSIKKIIFITIIIGIFGYVLSKILTDENIWLRLLLPSCTMLLLYVILSYIFNRKMFDASLRYARKLFHQ